VISNVLAFIFGVAALVCAIISLKQSKSLNVSNPLSICSIVISSFDILIGLIYVIFIVLYLVLGIGAGLLTEYELLFSLI
jgi:hypothetical protein